MKIKNEQVREIYDGWQKVWRNEALPEASRYKAYSIIEMLDALVAIYEHGDVLDEDHIDDLFIAWSIDGIRPVLPEKYPELLERLKKTAKEL